MDSGVINGTEDKIITASMTLTRQLLSVFMVTYLPTILMNIINQTINYICCENKEKIIVFKYIFVPKDSIILIGLNQK